MLFYSSDVVFTGGGGWVLCTNLWVGLCQQHLVPFARPMFTKTIKFQRLIFSSTVSNCGIFWTRETMLPAVLLSQNPFFYQWSLDEINITFVFSHPGYPTHMEKLKFKPNGGKPEGKNFEFRCTCSCSVWTFWKVLLHISHMRRQGGWFTWETSVLSCIQGGLPLTETHALQAIHHLYPFKLSVSGSDTISSSHCCGD